MILLYNNLYFGQEIMGHSKINASRRDHFLSGLNTWMGPNSPSSAHTDGVKKLQGTIFLRPLYYLFASN